MNASALTFFLAALALFYAQLTPKAAASLLTVPWMARANVRKNLLAQLFDERLSRLGVGLVSFALFGSSLAFTWPQAKAAVNWPGGFALSLFLLLHGMLAVSGASLAFELLTLRLSRAWGFLFFAIWCGLIHPLFLSWMQSGALSGPAHAGWIERLGAADPTLGLTVIALPACFAAATCACLGRKARPLERQIARILIGWAVAGLLLRMIGGASPLACLTSVAVTLGAALAGRVLYRLARGRGVGVSVAETQGVLLAVLPAAVGASATLSAVSSALLGLVCLGLATMCQGFFVRVLRVVDERVMTASVLAVSAALGALAVAAAGGFEGHAVAREMVFGLSLLALPLAQAVAVSAVMALGLGLGLATGYGLSCVPKPEREKPVRPEPRKARSQRLPGRPRAR